MNPAREKLESIDNIFKHTACLRVKITFFVLRTVFVLATFLWNFEKKLKCCIINLSGISHDTDAYDHVHA